MKILIEEYRLRKGLSLSELSRQSGVSIAHLSYLERGERTPTLTTLCKIAKALGVKTDDLFACEN